MAYNIKITTKATVAGVSDNFPLGAAITGMTIGDLCTVHWENDKNIAFDGNDQKVTPLLDDATSGVNSGTQMLAAVSAQTVKFTAKLVKDGATVATSTAVSIAFQPLHTSFKFITNKTFAPSIGYGNLAQVNLIKAIVTVTDSSQNPVEGAEIQWLTQPQTSTMSVYADAAGTRAPMDGGVPYSLSAATTGEATAFFADERTHQYLLLPQVLGSSASLQSTVFFAGTEGEHKQYKSVLIPGIDSDDYGQEYIDFISTQTYLSAQPRREDLQTADPNDFFYVLSNNNLIATTTVGQFPGDISVGYATLKPPLAEITQNVALTDMNLLTFFIQDSVTGNVGMSAPFKFYGVGEWVGNIPDPSSKLHRVLSQAQVVPTPGSNIITTDTINKYMELRAYIPRLPAKYDGKTATCLFYLNGYYKNDHKSQFSGLERHGSPDTGLKVTVTIVSGDKTKVVLPYTDIFGYALGPNSAMGFSYIDYYIDMGNGNIDYSIYPIKYGTNTDYP